MDGISPAVAVALKRFLEAVQSELKVDAAYLFGSAARGEDTPESDIDVAIISEAFRTMRRIDAIELLISKSRGLGIDLQPIGFSPEEMTDSGNFFARTIATEGIPLL